MIDAIVRKTKRTDDDEPLKGGVVGFIIPGSLVSHLELLGGKEEGADTGKGARIPKRWCKLDPHGYS